METGWFDGAPSAKNFFLKYSGQVGDRVRSVRGYLIQGAGTRGLTRAGANSG